MYYYPLTRLPAKKFELGDRVFNTIVDNDGREFVAEGTIFGYQYQHQLWMLSKNSQINGQINLNCFGWVYAVVITFEESGIDNQYDPFLLHYAESELSKIERKEHDEIGLSPELINNLFSKTYPLAHLLINSSIIVRRGDDGTTEIWIDCDQETAIEIREKAPDVRDVFDKMMLSKHIKIKVSDKVFNLPDLQVKRTGHQTFPIQIYMSEELLRKRQIRERASQYTNLLKGICSSGAVAATLHDADSKSGFVYLDLETYDPRRLNKQKLELQGNPCTIVDSAIGEPREFWIQRAIRNGSNARYSYTYDDKVLGVKFRFNVEVIYLPGKEEIITVVTDADPWQRRFWKEFEGEYQSQYRLPREAKS